MSIASLLRVLLGTQDQQLVKRMPPIHEKFANSNNQTITPFPSSSAPETTKASSSAPATSSLVPSPTSSLLPLTTSVSSDLPLATSVDSSLSSATSSPTSTDSSNSSSGGISSGAIGAIVAVVVIVIGGAIAFLLIRRRRNKRIAERAGAGAMRDPYNEGFGSFPPPPAPMAFTSNDYNASSAAGSAHSPPPVSYEYTMPPTNAYSNMPPMAQAQQPYPPMMVSSPDVMASPPPQQPQVLPPADGSQPGDIWQQPPLGTYIVTATYTPTLSDEIDIQAGDQVQVFEEYDDGWCLGLNLTRGQTRGVFPKHCVLPDSQNTSSNNLLPDDIQAKAGKRVSSLIMDKTQLL